MDQRVRFERNYPTQDSNGDPVPHWVAVVECWAGVDGAKASAEPYITDGIRSEADYTIWIRADIKERFAITVVDRVVWKDDPYDIKDMPDQQLRGRMIALMVNRGINDG